MPASATRRRSDFGVPASMTRRSTLLRAMTLMTSDAMLSKPVVWWISGISIAISALVALSVDGGNPAIFAMVDAVSLLLMFVALGVIWYAALRHLAGAARIVTTLFAFFAVGVLRGVLQMELHGSLGSLAVSSQDVVDRGLASGTRTLALLAVGTYVAALSSQSRDRVAILRARLAETEAALERTQQATALEYDRAVASVTAELNRQLASIDDSTLARAIQDTQAIAEDSVRPLSHRLAAEIPEIDVVLADPRHYQVSWPAFWRQLPAAKYIQPGWSVLLMVVLTFGTISRWGPVTATAALLVIGGLWYAGMRVARNLSSRTASIPSAAIRALINTMLFVLSSVPAAACWALCARATGNDVYIVVPFLIQAPLLMWFVSAAFALADQISSASRAIDEAEDRLTWLVARAKLVSWHQNGKLARALHGPVQSELHAALSAMRVEQSKPARDHSLARQLTVTLQKRLPEIIENDLGAREVNRAIDAAAALWRGIAEISYVPDGPTQLILASDSAANDVCVSVIQDAISNAVRHGKATRIDVAIALDDDADVVLNVRDNGRAKPESTAIAAPGIGLTQVRDCAVEWEITQGAEGYRLLAVFPAESGDFA